jgi:hypothetical protein
VRPEPARMAKKPKTWAEKMVEPWDRFDADEVP